MRRWRYLVLPMVCGVAAPAACSSFDEERRTSADGGDAGNVPGDGAVADDAAELFCPTYPVGSIDGKVAQIWALPENADEVEFPFQIATDSDAIYWAAQPLKKTLLPDAAALAGPYNSNAVGRIRRASKAEPLKAVTLVDAQLHAETVALDGPYVYWTATSGSQSSLLRTRRDCTPPCSVETEVPLAIPRPQRPLRLAPGLLGIQTDAEQFYTIALDALVVGPQLLRQSVVYTKTAAAGGEVFVATSGSSAPVVKFQLSPEVTKNESWGTLPAITGAAYPGMGALGSDGTDVFGIRSDRGVWRVPVAGGAFTRWVDSGVSEAVWVEVDARYVYVAGWNGGGVFAFDKQTTARTTLHVGNVWSVNVDRDGIYWGEHGMSLDAGRIYFVRR